MTKKNISLFAFAIVAVLGLSSVSMAWGGRGGCPGYGQGQGYQAQQQLTAEQQQAVQDIYAKHEDRMIELRDALWAKNVELDALVESGSADRAAIQGLTAEITELRTQLRAEGRTMADEMAEATGIENFGYGRGYAGCPGYGAGQGRGQGGCWR